MGERKECIMPNKVHLKAEEYIATQVDHALGEVNRYYTAQEVQMDPNPDQCVEHWIRCGGADWFYNHYDVAEDSNNAVH